MYARRGYNLAPLLRAHRQLKACQRKLNQLEKKQNPELATQIEQTRHAEKFKQSKLQALLRHMPNLPHPNTPIQNTVVFEQPLPDLITKPHWELAEAVGIDFATGIELHGKRGYVLRGEAAKMERKLANLALDFYAAKGYEEVAVPYLIKPEMAEATGHLPKFAAEMYQVQTGHYLIPTGELPLANLHRNERLDLKQPLKYMTHTPCFRLEKFGAGRDTRGLKRVHQFNKVELFQFAKPEDAETQHQQMVADILEFLGQLQLPCRVVDLCPEDFGFAAARAYDIEVWLPGQQAWMEVATITNCTDFQARRTKTRYAKGKYAHTLNGTGIATGRVLLALLENQGL